VSQKKPVPGKKEIFVYFNNDAKLNAPQDALRMLNLLKIKL
jgi:uncharacterized protein YecE (DUF72 family)